MGGLLCTLHKETREKWDVSVICLWKMKIMKIHRFCICPKLAELSGWMGRTSFPLPRLASIREQRRALCTRIIYANPKYSLIFGS